MFQRLIRAAVPRSILLLVLGVSAFAQLNISNTPSAPSVSPRIAVDSQGNVHAVWVEQTSLTTGDVYYAKGNISTLQISAPVKLSSSNTVYCDTVEMCSIAIDGSDRVYVAWTEGWPTPGTIKLRTCTNGTWDSPYTVFSGTRLQAPRITATSAGNLYIVFWNNQWQVLSTARIGGVWETAQLISQNGRATKMADISVGTNSVGVVYVQKVDPTVGDYYQAAYTQRSIALNAAWSAPQLMGPAAGVNQQHPALRLGTDDTVHAVWTNLIDDAAGVRVVLYSNKAVGASWTSPLLISLSEVLHYPFMSRQGNDIYVCWQVGGYGNGSSVDYNVRYANGTWRGRSQVANSNGVTYCDIGATPNKAVLFFVWDTLVGLGNGEIYGWMETIASVNVNISGAVRTAAGAPVAGATITFSNSGGTATSGADGTYTKAVSFGWAGTATPSKAGYSFSPTSRSYAGVAADQANQNFTATALAVTVLSPNGGEVWQAGSARNITWSTGGTSDPVKIEYSANGGTSYGMVTASTANNGLYAWSVPVSTTSNGLIKITSLGSGGYSDTSDAPFSIVPTSVPFISLNRTSVAFGAVSGGVKSPAQSVIISNTGSGSLSWTATTTGSPNFVRVTPTQGSGNGVIQVDVDPTGIAAGTYAGTVRVTDAGAANSPQVVNVKLNVETAGATSSPFGSFDTPLAGSTVSSNVPVSGWALDDIGLQPVKIYRNPVSGEQGGSNGLVYIGDALYVDGSRNDIPGLYPDYPANYKAGWGYMLLSNTLPNQGNGAVTLHAIVTDLEGHAVELGTKTITCDNAHATKPFGAIDTPTQGGNASGTAFINFGWALTPMPKNIPVDGSTIWVYVDGVPVGHPVYGQRRDDIVALFPGYANTTTAVGSFSLNTTAYANGVHSLSWSVTDSGGQADGIGSRFFNIINTAAGGSPQPLSAAAADAWISPARDLKDYQTDGITPLYQSRGYAPEAQPLRVEPGKDGARSIEIRETERIVVALDPAEMRSAEQLAASRAVRIVRFPDALRTRAFLVDGAGLRPLPIGATFDAGRGVLYWQPGPGFIGRYEFVFIAEGTRGAKKIPFTITILPKFDKSQSPNP